MRTGPCRWGSMACFIAVMILPLCASADDWVELDPESTYQGQILAITGTVYRVDPEFDLFVIRDAEGGEYHPINLPRGFRDEGIDVEAEVRGRDDIMVLKMGGAVVELLRIRHGSGEHVAPVLWGTSWRLEDLAGAGAIDEAQATLEFPENGRVSGSGSCNQFNGTVTITGNSIAFGPLGTTKMACSEPVMQQESRFLAALNDAQRFELEGSFLSIFIAGQAEPLRFIDAR
jgi:heat shock protein HslJ